MPSTTSKDQNQRPRLADALRSFQPIQRHLGKSRQLVMQAEPTSLEHSAVHVRMPCSAKSFLLRRRRHAGVTGILASWSQDEPTTTLRITGGSRLIVRLEDLPPVAKRR